MIRSKNRTGCTMSTGYVCVHESDAKIRRVVATKSKAQLEREREEAERDNDIRMLLRAGEGDNRPITRRP